jgi:uncharacterized HAD superfamily protein
MKSKLITVGVDFDGVLVYNPLRVIRAPVTFIKKKVFKNKRTHFYIPKNDFEKFAWTIFHESSIFPALGVDLLRERVEAGEIEAHLVTARYSFLQKNLYAWLDAHNLRKTFKTITINEKNEQPHLYKERIIKEHGFDYFIEDNFDIVEHTAAKTNSKILWIYNILDRSYKYSYKYPYLEKALKSI